MKVSAAIKTIGTGLAYEKSTASQVKSAGGELLRQAESIEKMEESAVKYQELIMAVGIKFPDESRHETALRYIQQAESHCEGPVEAKGL